MEKNEINYKELFEMFSQLKQSITKYLLKEQMVEPEETSTSLEEKFANLVTRLDEQLNKLSVESELYLKFLCMKSSIYYEQAKMLSSMGGETAEGMMEKAISTIEERSDEVQVTYLYMRLINHFSFLLLNRGDLERSQNYLESIIQKYENKTGIKTYSTEDLFSGAEFVEDEGKISRLMANNFQLLGWVYGKLGKLDMQAEKQHKALEKQLGVEIYDPVGWACSCMKLAALYLAGLRFHQARYHLQAAGSSLDRFERALVEHPDLGRVQAELAREWVSYSLQLFSVSRTKCLESRYPEVFQDTRGTDEEAVLDDVTLFPNLEVEVESVPVNFITTAEQARNLFLYTHTWLKRMRMYFTLRDFPLHYVNSVLDLSELYRYLAFYEGDLDAQYAVHKRRADALETLCTVLRDVRPQCYIAVSVELLRELTEVQIEMMGINLRRIHMTNNDVQSEDKLRRGISAITDVQAKLEALSVTMGQNIIKHNQGYEVQKQNNQILEHQ